MVFITFHNRSTKVLKDYREYVFIDSDIENHMLASLSKKDIAILYAVCTSIPLDYRDSLIHNLFII